MNDRIFEVFEATRRGVEHEDEIMSDFMQEFAERLVEEIADYCEEIDGGENYFSRNIRREFAHWTT